MMHSQKDAQLKRCIDRKMYRQKDVQIERCIDRKIKGVQKERYLWVKNVQIKIYRCKNIQIIREIILER